MKGWGGGEGKAFGIDRFLSRWTRSIVRSISRERFLPRREKISSRQWVQRRSFKLLCKMKNEYSTRHECVCVYVCVYCMYVCVYMRFSVSPVLRFSRFFFSRLLLIFFFFFLPFLLLFLNYFGGEIGYSVHATR